MLALTPENAKLLAYIKAYNDEQGCCPTYDEMAAHMGTSHKSTVNRWVNQLVERGAIRVLRHKKRGIVLCDHDMMSLTIGLPSDLASQLFMRSRATKKTREEIVLEAVKRYFAMPVEEAA